LVNENETIQTNIVVNDPYNTRPCYKHLPGYLSVERCVCFWSSWLSRLTSSWTAVTLSSVCACFGLHSHAFGRCFLFPGSFSVVFSHLVF